MKSIVECLAGQKGGSCRQGRHTEILIKQTDLIKQKR